MLQMGSGTMCAVIMATATVKRIFFMLCQFFVCKYSVFLYSHNSCPPPCELYLLQILFIDHLSLFKHFVEYLVELGIFADDGHQHLAVGVEDNLRGEGLNQIVGEHR